MIRVEREIFRLIGHGLPAPVPFSVPPLRPGDNDHTKGHGCWLNWVSWPGRAKVVISF